MHRNDQVEEAPHGKRRKRRSHMKITVGVDKKTGNWRLGKQGCKNI